MQHVIIARGRVGASVKAISRISKGRVTDFIRIIEKLHALILGDQDE